MFATRRTLPEEQRRVLFLALSCLVHAAVFFQLQGKVQDKSGLHIELPALVEFGLSDKDPGGGTPGTPPPPPPQPTAAKSVQHPRAALVKSDSITLPVDAGVAHDLSTDAAVASAQTADGGAPSDLSASGTFGDGSTGPGSGGGPGGDGSGYAPKGATIALNMDLDRVRKTALVLETRALLDIVPEWEMLLDGSGLDSSKDLTRVFVATPDLQRASLVVAARTSLTRDQVQAAADRLAAEHGEQAVFRTEQGFPVAPWWNRGPTRRVIALTATDQITITRAEDLSRVLAVARALAQQRAREGFTPEELKKQGGLLAMRDNEAVALWIEGVRRYLPAGTSGVPLSMRMSVDRIDEFHTELRAFGRYESSEQAEAALSYLDGVRKELADNPRVMFLGLRNALNEAVIEQDKQMLVLRVALTLHQTRYLMGYVSAALKPRDADPAHK